MIQMNSSIVLNERLTKDCWRIVLEAPQIASEVRPGQFINVKVEGATGPLLRRPFSIFRCRRFSNRGLVVEVVYKIAGRGTRLMADLRPGDMVDIIGPLGHGFTWSRGKKTHVLIGGGIGSATLYLLGEEISKSRKECGLELYILLGAEAKAVLILEKEFSALKGEVLVSTDDGSYGHRGLITESFKDYIDHGKISSDCAIYACGPEAMIKALAPICREYGIPAQVSLERHMMCGIGACLTCVCKVDKRSVLNHRDVKSSYFQFVPDRDFGHALVCKDGPVFDMDEVILDES